MSSLHSFLTPEIYNPGCQKELVMPGTAVGLFLIDFIFRPFAKIYEKMPLVMLLMLLCLYSIIGYIVIKSAYLADQQR